MASLRGLVIAAPASGSGKTVITLGLLRALRGRGLKVASAKVGPDYIDPRFHEAATGQTCFNVDPWAMPSAVIQNHFKNIAKTSDFVIVEGVMGLFDGPQGAAGSTADLAASLRLPVVLVVDARHQSQSIAALVHGFATYRQDIDVAGVILNRVASTAMKRCSAKCWARTSSAPCGTTTHWFSPRAISVCNKPMRIKTLKDLFQTQH